MTERPILIVGSPRSGTTLLRDLLRSHPRLTFPPESNVLPSLYRLHGDPSSPRRARWLARDLLGSFSIRAWALDVCTDDLVGERSFAAMTARLYDAWAQREQKPRWGDKTPLHALDLPTALAIFPGAQVLHLIRDGRDVAASLVRQPWGPACAATAARLWRRCVEAAIRDGTPLGTTSYLGLRFEELVVEPERVLGEVCAFLGEQFHPAVLAPSRLPAPPGVAQPWPPSHERALDTSVVGRWRSELSAGDRAIVEAEAGGTLRQLGYRTDGSAQGGGRRGRVGCRARDAAAFLRWRATSLDRVPRATTTLRLARAHVMHRLGLIGTDGA